MVTMLINYLADRPVADIELVARWIFDEWSGEFAQQGLEAWLVEFRSMLRRSGIPTAFAAVDGERVVGTASLIASDLPELPHCAPWLASLYVPPGMRGRGVGAALVGRVEAEARALGFRQLYLQTAWGERYYQRLGWATVDWTMFRGQPVKIMTRDLLSTERAA